MYDAIIEFPKMKVAVKTRDGCVTDITYLPPSVEVQKPTNPLAERAARQLERYRDHPDVRFELPLLIEGSEFQRRLWDALCTIPRGKTLTYGELAQRLGAEARAVGQACGDNRLPIVIPCHRVVASDGLGSYGSLGPDYKQRLLALEGVTL